jgi:hypothetical protein
MEAGADIRGSPTVRLSSDLGSPEREPSLPSKLPPEPLRCSYQQVVVEAEVCAQVKLGKSFAGGSAHRLCFVRVSERNVEECRTARNFQWEIRREQLPMFVQMRQPFLVL